MIRAMISYYCLQKRRAHHGSKVLVSELLLVQVVSEFSRYSHSMSSANLALVAHQHELEPDSGQRHGQ